MENKILIWLGIVVVMGVFVIVVIFGMLEFVDNLVDKEVSV